MKVTLEEFHSNTIAMQHNTLLLKEEALDILEPIFEDFPYLRDAINRSNPYRIHIGYTEFQLFFLPAMKYCGIIDSYELIDYKYLHLR